MYWIILYFYVLDRQGISHHQSLISLQTLALLLVGNILECATKIHLECNA